jgi:hypothetical protein
MRHFQVTVSCQGVRSSLAVILDKDLERAQIRKICEACVKDNYEVEITRRRDCSDIKWVTLGEMIHRLVELRLHKITYEKVSAGITECHHGQAISIPDCISPVHAMIRKYYEGDQTVYINLDPKFDYLRIDYAAYAAELNRQDLKLIFRPWITSNSYPNGIGICADLPKNAEDARVVIDCPLVNITWTESTLKYETKQVKTEL